MKLVRRDLLWFDSSNLSEAPTNDLTFEKLFGHYRLYGESRFLKKDDNNNVTGPIQ